jgi:uncharacterized protein (DUF1697 family)
MMIMMSKYVAMIRGIGPGNPNMTSAAFKSFFEGLGFTGVQTVLSSGNIVFESSGIDADALAKRIEKALPQKLGYSRSVIVRSQTELQNLIDLDPFKGIEQDHNKGKYLLVTFFRNTPDMPFDLPFVPENKPYTILGKIDDAIYGSIDLLGTPGAKTPDYMAWLEKQFGKDITSRTPKTIRLILSKM